MSTPTPRTSAAIIASGFQAVPEGFRAFAGNLERELTALTTERDQLRAEVERLNALGSWSHTCIHHTDDERKAWAACPCCAIARAKRAEAEVERLKTGGIVELAAINSSVLEYCKHWEARAEQAESELAAERARLDYMSARGFAHRHHGNGDHLAFEWTISSTNELKDVSLRAVIDAAMQEGAK